MILEVAGVVSALLAWLRRPVFAVVSRVKRNRARAAENRARSHAIELLRVIDFTRGS